MGRSGTGRAWWRWASGTLALAAGAALRLGMFVHLFEANGDTLLYGGIAKNLLLHGVYGFEVGGRIVPTLIRLPGYPLFLAVCFKVFGMENYAGAVWVQIPLELAGCLLLADVARRMAPSAAKTMAAHATLWLAALCPFTGVYAAMPLTETPTLFVIALALWAAVRFRESPGWGAALAFTVAVTYSALLRPDGALAAVALAPAIGAAVWQARPGTERRRLVRIAAVCVLLALAPFVAWTWRNWMAFHIVQPLAPRYANDPGDDPHLGWQRWMKTWNIDYVSTYAVYWNVPGDVLDLSALPARAFDSSAQRAETEALAEEYNRNGYKLTPALDAGFARLAEERIDAHPLRYYMWLPLGRVADMWFRPRVENLNIDLDWWVYAHHNAETRFSWAYAALNAAYVLLGLIGLWLRPKLWPYLLAYFVLRSALLATIEGPEARYTLECFPMLFVLGGVALSTAASRMLRTTSGS